MNYILNEHGIPVLEPDIYAWARWYQTAERRVDLTWIGDVRVSTVFLGVDHNFGWDDRPLLYETMVFGGDLDMECERYSTREEALVGHIAMVQRVREETI